MSGSACSLSVFSKCAALYSSCLRPQPTMTQRPTRAAVASTFFMAFMSLGQFFHHFDDGDGMDREGDALGVRAHGAVDADELPVDVEERTTRIAGIDVR